MTDSLSRQTAKIYQFPVKSRTDETGQATNAKQVADLGTPQYARTESGSGWYHEAAIREAEQHWR
jgi:hypothetical protein